MAKSSGQTSIPPTIIYPAELGLPKTFMVLLHVERDFLIDVLIKKPIFANRPGYEDPRGGGAYSAGDHH